MKQAAGSKQHPVGGRRRVRNFLILAFCLLPSAFCLSACGKRRPPLPPVERVPQRTELLSGAQRGKHVLVEVERGEDDDAGTRIPGVDLGNGGPAVDAVRLADSESENMAGGEEPMLQRVNDALLEAKRRTGEES